MSPDRLLLEPNVTKKVPWGGLLLQSKDLFEELEGALPPPQRGRGRNSHIPETRGSPQRPGLWSSLARWVDGGLPETTSSLRLLAKAKASARSETLLMRRRGEEASHALGQHADVRACAHSQPLCSSNVCQSGPTAARLRATKLSLSIGTEGSGSIPAVKKTVEDPAARSRRRHRRNRPKQKSRSQGINQGANHRNQHTSSQEPAQQQPGISRAATKNQHSSCQQQQPGNSSRSSRSQQHTQQQPTAEASATQLRR